MRRYQSKDKLNNIMYQEVIDVRNEDATVEYTATISALNLYVTYDISHMIMSYVTDISEKLDTQQLKYYDFFSVKQCILEEKKIDNIQQNIRDFYKESLNKIEEYVDNNQYDDVSDCDWGSGGETWNTDDEN